MLITGGEVNADTLAATAAAEVFDERTGKFTALRCRNAYSPRGAHTCDVKLRDGRVVIVGGMSGRKAVSRRQPWRFYEPKARTFTLVGPLSVPRYKHAACLMNDGSVLIVGGSDEKDWK